jgi:hypothetical protein
VRKQVLFISILCFHAHVTLYAQGTNVCLNTRKVGCLIPNLYQGGLRLPAASEHNAHFVTEAPGSSLPITPLVTSVGSELTLLPLASPASGFVYTFDPSLGVFSETQQSFGPILTERAETIGKRRVFVGFTYQRFRFNTIDDLSMKNLPAVFTHDPNAGVVGAAAKLDVITTDNRVDLKLDQYTTFVTVGLTNRFDVSLAIPIVDAKMTISSQATIRRNPASTEIAHYFNENDKVNSTQRFFSDSSSASGIGDLVVRMKYTAIKGESSGIAIGADLRFPTGDETNLLGSGAVGFKPFIAASLPGTKFLFPHVNLGYEVNGKSILAGDITTGRKEHLPNQFLYSAGVDIGVNRRLTLALDYLGQLVVHGPHLEETFVQRPFGNFPTIDLHKQSHNLSSGATGFKFSPTRHLLLSANVLFKLNNAGLRANVAPLVGLSYTF